MQINELLEKEGYRKLRYVQGVGWCGLMPMLFTTGIMLDLDEIGPAQGRYCFSEWAEAAHFLENWDGITEPVAGVNGCTANKRANKR
jgi:hypothetical protein